MRQHELDGALSRVPAWQAGRQARAGVGHALAHDEAPVENVAIGVCVDALPVALAIAAVLPNVPTPVVVLEPPRL